MKVFVIVSLVLVTTAAFKLQDTKGDAILPSENRIIGGQNAQPGEFLYQAVLLMRNGPKQSWCSGSLIGHEFILTAGHCTSGFESATIQLGSTNRHNGAQYKFVVSSKNFIIHKYFNPVSLANDIALIKIPYIQYTTLVKRIKLPPYSFYHSFANTRSIASGWGRNSDNNQGGVDDLLWTRLHIADNRHCASFQNFINENNLCVDTTAGTSTCKGDSGGPLVTEDKQMLIGVTSFGHTQCTIGYPAVFTRVTTYVKWIYEKTGIRYD